MSAPINAQGGRREVPPGREGGVTMTIGTNNESAARLATFIERIERIRAEKKQCALDEAAVIAEAKGAGYHGGAIRAVIKIRGMKPVARQESEVLLGTYLHALGMANEPPLHRQIGMLGVDISSRDSVIAAMASLVPENGSITVETKEGRPVKMTRDKAGNITVTDVVEAAPGPRGAPSPAPGRPEPPAVDADEAEALGRAAFKANAAIITNPFPFSDPRRARWDLGWRKESGGDGMGPDEG